MPTNAHAVSVSEIKYAIENRDGRRLANMYADDAVLRVVGPGQPTEQAARDQGQGGNQRVLGGRVRPDHDPQGRGGGCRKRQARLTAQACAYPEGGKVLCHAMLELKDGKIAQQTAVQVWDE